MTGCAHASPVVIMVSRSGERWLLDGAHRIRAAKKSGDMVRACFIEA